MWRGVGCAMSAQPQVQARASGLGASAEPALVMNCNKLAHRIWEQAELVKAQQAGTQFAPTRFRTVVASTKGRVNLLNPRQAALAFRITP